MRTFWIHPHRHPRGLYSLAALAAVGGIVGITAARVVAQGDAAGDAAPTAPAVIAVQAEPQKPTDKAEERLSQAEREKLNKELEDLTRQRNQLEERIRGVRQKLGLRPRARVFVGPNEFFLTPEREADAKLTPEQKKKAEEAMRRAEEAVKRAEEAMREAEKAIPESLRRRRLFVQPFVTPDFAPVPAVPPLPPFPKWESPDGTRRFFFRFDNKDGNDKDWEKRSQEFRREMERWAEEYSKGWEKQRPEFEKRMKEFQERMLKWHKEYESRMQKSLKERKERSKDPKKKESSATDYEREIDLELESLAVPQPLSFEGEIL